MSHTLELLSTIEHGTVAGYEAGCHGSATSCGGVVSCQSVYIRYQADWGFRKRINAGETAAAIIAAEHADAENVRARDRAANRAAKEEGAKAAVDRERKQRTARGTIPARPRRADRLDPDDVTHLHGLGWTDVAIGDELGFSSAAIGKARKRLGLSRNVQERAPRPVGARRVPRAPRQPSPRTIRRQRIQELHAEGLTDNEIVERLDITRMAVSQVRNRLDLPVNPDSRAGKKFGPRASVQYREDLRRLHGEGKTDREIAATLDVSLSYASDLRRQEGLTANRSAASKWDGKNRLGHGTNARYAGGCRCHPCIEANREYMRAYRAKRREAGAGAHHGTAYGYQLGCRGKGCPSDPTCTDAMLDADRARRRAAGVPEKHLVDAGPVRAHLRDLKAAGMTGDQIAAAAGVPSSAVTTVLHSRGVGRGPVDSLLADRAAALLNVSIPKEKR